MMPENADYRIGDGLAIGRTFIWLLSDGRAGVRVRVRLERDAPGGPYHIVETSPDKSLADHVGDLPEVLGAPLSLPVSAEEARGLGLGAGTVLDIAGALCARHARTGIEGWRARCRRDLLRAFTSVSDTVFEKNRPDPDMLERWIAQAKSDGERGEKRLRRMEEAMRRSLGRRGASAGARIDRVETSVRATFSELTTLASVS